MKHAIRWALINGVIGGCLVAGLVFGIGGALNVGIFATWYLFVISFACLAEKIPIMLAAKPEWPSVPRWVDHTFDLGILFLLVWHGRWYSGAAYAIRFVLALHLYEAVAKIRSSNARNHDSSEAR